MFISNDTIDPAEEKKVITSFIVSDRVANELVPLTNRELFKLDASKIVFSWVADFYKVFKSAPKVNIVDIYEKNKVKLRPEDNVLITEFLSTLSSEFEDAQWKNEEYLIETAKKYLRKRHLITMSDNIKKFAEADLLEDAEKHIDRYGSLVDSGLSGWRKPFDDSEFISNVFNRVHQDPLVHLGGAVDTLIGPLKRAWLMMILGPMKRGKTRTMLDFALHSMAYGNKVAFLSLEMEDTDVSFLLYQKLKSAPAEDGDILYPIMDCKINQSNSCSHPARQNNVRCPQTFVPNSIYKPCSICRNISNDFQPTTWFQQVFRKAPTKRDVADTLESFRMQFGYDLLRLKSYPVESVNINTIDMDLKALEMATGWIPDVIVIDYADILMPEQKGLEGRDKENAAWKAMKRLAQTRKALVITGSQGNRGSFDTDTLAEGNTSEDIRKLAHIDLSITLNQTNEEKLKGIMRIGLLNHRWKKFNKNIQALVLQCMEVGQFNLDSTIVDMNKYNV